MQITAINYGSSVNKAIGFFFGVLITLTIGMTWCIFMIYNIFIGIQDINSFRILILIGVLIGTFTISMMFTVTINLIIELMFPKTVADRLLKRFNRNRNVPHIEKYRIIGKDAVFQFCEGTFHISTIVKIPLTSIPTLEELDKKFIKYEKGNLSVHDNKGNQKIYSGDIANDLKFLLWIHNSLSFKEYFKDKEKT